MLLERCEPLASGLSCEVDPSFSTPGAAGNTVFYNEALGGFYNVFMPFGSSVAYMQSASAPEGPWSCT